MKVGDLKDKIQSCSVDQLQRIIVEVYKAIPKSIKEEQGIDALILNPNSEKKQPHVAVLPAMETIKTETEEFLSNAYNQYYFAPNSVVPKRERPTWRFTARRLFKNLNQLAADQNNMTEAVSLLKRLYEMLCYSCDYVLFSAYDPFQSVGISQVEFFHAALSAMRKIKSPKNFVHDSILLALNNSLNRYTLYEDLFQVVVGFLETADLKGIAVEICEALRGEIAANQYKDLRSDSGDLKGYRREKLVQNLAILGWMCYMALGQEDEAVRYFRDYYAEKNPEIVLYVLLRMIEHYRRWDLWLKIYQEAVDRGVRPRGELQRSCREIREKLNQEPVQRPKEGPPRAE